MICIIMAMSDIDLTPPPQSIGYPTFFTKIHLLQFITPPPKKIAILGKFLTLLYIRPPTIREGRVGRQPIDVFHKSFEAN